MVHSTAETPDAARSALRTKLLAKRAEFVASPAGAPAELALAQVLRQVIDHLEPECLGLYWAMRSEFNAATLWAADTTLPIALPFALREGRQMHYRRWDGTAPRVKDECGIAASDGAPVVPDVVLVPCVGFTPEGYRLGYGGGYFDRWLAAHPHVTAVGVAYSVAQLSEAELVPAAHDQPLALVVTEHGVVCG